jgi:hypothetical protein
MLNIACPSKLNIINIGPGRVYPPYSTTRAVLSLLVCEERLRRLALASSMLYM